MLCGRIGGQNHDVDLLAAVEPSVGRQEGVGVDQDRGRQMDRVGRAETVPARIPGTLLEDILRSFAAAALFLNRFCA